MKVAALVLLLGGAGAVQADVAGEWRCQMRYDPQGFSREFGLILHPDGTVLGEGQGESGPYLLQGRWSLRQGAIFAYGEERQILEPSLSGRFALELRVAGDTLLSQDPQGKCRRGLASNKRGP